MQRLDSPQNNTSGGGASRPLYNTKREEHKMELLHDTGAGEFIALMVIMALCYIWDRVKLHRRNKRLKRTPYGRYILRREGIKW